MYLIESMSAQIARNTSINAYYEPDLVLCTLEMFTNPKDIWQNLKKEGTEFRFSVQTLNIILIKYEIPNIY